MPKCRFYEDHHDYAQDECDRAFCKSVLVSCRARLVPLPLEPDPKACQHEWDVYFAKMRVPWSARAKPGWEASPELCVRRGLLVMSDHSFSICAICGAVSYNHSELGGPLLCLPEPRKKPHGK